MLTQCFLSYSVLCASVILSLAIICLFICKLILILQLLYTITIGNVYVSVLVYVCHVIKTAHSSMDATAKEITAHLLQAIKEIESNGLNILIFYASLSLLTELLLDNM